MLQFCERYRAEILEDLGYMCKGHSEFEGEDNWEVGHWNIQTTYLRIELRAQHVIS